MKLNAKKVLCILLSFGFILSLASCSLGKDTDVDFEIEETETEETTETDYGVAGSYRTIYGDFLNDYYNEHSSEFGGNPRFGMFRIDADSVPELLISIADSHGYGANIYTIRGGEVKELGVYGSYGDCTLGDGNGIISSYYTQSGVCEEMFYKLEGGEVSFIWGGYEELVSISGNEDDEVHEYSILKSEEGLSDESQREKTDEESYNSELEKYEHMTSYSTTDNALMYEYTPDNVDYYMKNYRTEEFDAKTYSTAKEEITERITSDNEYYSYVDTYFCDLNGDGNDDLMYYTDRNPFVCIYSNGQFVENEIDSEVKAGSLFPSGTNSGLFFDTENGIIIYRYGGHTQGTALYNGAEAYQIDGTKLTSLWVLYADEEHYYNLYPNAEDLDKAEEECRNDFEQKYQDKISGLNFTNFFDVCTMTERNIITSSES